jgi:hypothetical protein
MQALVAMQIQLKDEAYAQERLLPTTSDIPSPEAASATLDTVVPIGVVVHPPANSSTEVADQTNPSAAQEIKVGEV